MLFIVKKTAEPNLLKFYDDTLGGDICKTNSNLKKNILQNVSFFIFNLFLKFHRQSRALQLVIYYKC